MDLEQEISPNFHQIHCDIKKERYSDFWLKGGRGSTKSTFAAQQIILGIVSDPKANSIVFRKTANTIRTSTLTTLLFAIDKLNLSNQFDHTKSPPEITYLPTGQQIIMKGLDEPTKLKSIRPEKGYFKLVWFEEGEEYSGIEEIRSVRQSVLRGGEKFIILFTYNPPRNPNHWLYKEIKYNDPDRSIHHSHYKDVPESWLGSKFFKDAERLKINNFEAYQHEYGGLPVQNPEEIIFSGKYEVRDFETPPVNELYQSRFFFGADWGFANDPSVLVRMFIKDDCLWIDYAEYGYHIEIDFLGKKLFDKVPESRKWRIKADNSRPETISNLRRQGFNIVAAKKWTGCVDDGIEYLKSFRKIYIHTRCAKKVGEKQTILEEHQNYSYKIDKNTKQVLPIVNDKAGWDHGIDAERYGLDDYIGNRIITNTGFSI